MPVSTKGCDLLLGTIPLMFFRGRDQAVMDGDSDPGSEPTEPAQFGNFTSGLGASELQLPGMYADGDDIDTMTPGVVLPAGERVEISIVGVPRGTFTSFEYGTDFYFTMGRALYKIVNGTDLTPQLVLDAGPDVTLTSAVEFNGFVYIGSEVVSTGAIAALYRFNGTTWITATGVNYRHLAVVYWDVGGVGAHRLIGTSSQYQFKSVSGDPMVAANWTTPIAVGTSTYHIRSIAAAPRHVWFGKQEGLFDVDARGYTPNITPHWRNNYDIENGAATLALGRYAYGSHAYGMDRIPLGESRQVDPEPVEPGAILPYSGKIYGRPVAITAWRGRIIAAWHNATRNESYVLFGRDNGTDFPPVIWQGSYSTVPGRVQHLKVHSPPVPGFKNVYLWIFTANDVTGEYKAYRQYLAKGGSAYQELINGGAPRFQTSATLRMPDGWPDHRTIGRSPWRIRLESERLGPVAAIDVSLSADAGAYEAQAMVNTSPYETFAARLANGQAMRIRPQVVLRGTATQPAVFRSMSIDADLSTEQADVRTYVVTLGADQSLGQGSIDPRDDLQLLRDIMALQSEDSEPVTLIDEDEQTWLVQVLPVMRRRKLEDREGNWVTALTLRVRILEDIWYLDTGVLLDTGRRLN